MQVVGRFHEQWLDLQHWVTEVTEAPTWALLTPLPDKVTASLPVGWCLEL